MAAGNARPKKIPQRRTTRKTTAANTQHMAALPALPAWATAGRPATWSAYQQAPDAAGPGPNGVRRVQRMRAGVDQFVVSHVTPPFDVMRMRLPS